MWRAWRCQNLSGLYNRSRNECWSHHMWESCCWLLVSGNIFVGPVPLAVLRTLALIQFNMFAILMSWINYGNCLTFWKWPTLFSTWNSPPGSHSGGIRIKDKLWPLDQSWAIPQACCAHTPASARQASCTSLLALWGIATSSCPQTWDAVLLWPWRNYPSPSLCLSMLLLSTQTSGCYAMVT